MSTHTTSPEGAAEVIARLLARAGLALRVRAWDGSEAGPAGPPVLVARSPRALQRIGWRPGELGLARAYVSGDLDVDGDLAEGLRRLRAASRPRPLDLAPAALTAIRAASRLKILAPPPPRRPASSGSAAAATAAPATRPSSPATTTCPPRSTSSSWTPAWPTRARTPAAQASPITGEGRIKQHRCHTDVAAATSVWHRCSFRAFREGADAHPALRRRGWRVW